MNGWTPLDMAPGVLVALTALAADWLLRRFYDPIPARVWLVFAVVVLVMFAPVLFGNFTLMPLDLLPEFAPWQPYAEIEESGNRIQIDLIEELVPWQAQVRRSLKQGELPLWNPSSGAGAPLLGNPQTTPFHPLNLLTLPLPLPGAVPAQAALRVLIALLSMYLLLRRSELDELPSLMGALAYGLCGYLLLFLGWPHANAASFLPLLLYANLLWFSRGGRASLVLLVVSMLSIGLSGHPESVLYVLLAFAAHSLLLLSDAASRERVRLVGWLGAGILAVLIALPALAPALSYLPQTTRYAGMEERNQALKRQSFEDWQVGPTLRTLDERLLPIVAPNAYGNNRWREFWGSLNSNESSGGFAGSATLLAALLVMFGWGDADLRTRLLRIVAVLLVIVVARPPGLPQLMVRVPPFDSSPTFHRRMLMLLAFAVAGLAALAWQRWTKSAPPRRTLVVAAVGLAGLVAWAYLGHPKPGDPGALAGVRYATLALQVVCIAVATGLLWKVGSVRRQVAMVVLVGVELVAIHRPSHPAVTKELFFPETPSINFLQSRLWSDEGRAFRMSGLHTAMPPESATIFDLRDARASGPSQSKAFRDLTRALRNPQFPLIFQTVDHPLLDLLAVRYVLASARHTAEPPLVEVYRDEDAVVLERPNALPILFLPESAELDDETWSAVRGGSDFGQRSYLQLAPGTSARNETSAPLWQSRGSAASLRVDAVRANRLTVTVETGERRLLASSIYQDGNWRVLVDGERVPTLEVNGPFLGAWLPAGASRVEVVYRPRSLLPTATASLLAVLLLAAVVVRNRQVGPWEETP